MKRTFTIKRNNQIIGILTSDNNFKYTKKSLALIYDIDKKILMLNTIDIIECNNNDTFSFSKNFIKISKEDEISDFLNNFKETIKLMIPPCFLYKFNDDGTLNDEDGGIEDTFDYYMNVNELNIKDYSIMIYKWKDIIIKIDNNNINVNIANKLDVLTLNNIPEINNIWNTYRYYQILQRIESFIDFINDKEVKFDEII